MARTNTKQDNGKGLGPESFTTEPMMNSFDGLEPSKLAIKIGIGYVYAVLSWLAADNLTAMLITFSMPVWVKFIVAFACLCVAIVFIVKTTPFVANTVYDAGAYVANKAKAGYKAARAKFSAFQMPSFASHTTH